MRRDRPFRGFSLAALVCLIAGAQNCARSAPQAKPERSHVDAVPLETDHRVYTLIKQGRCEEASRALDGLPESMRDVQWHMRRADTGICNYRKTKQESYRQEVVALFERGMKKYPDSTRLMLEYGVACTAWDDLEGAKRWWKKAADLASRHIEAGINAHGLDDEEAVKAQAEDLLLIATGGEPKSSVR